MSSKYTVVQHSAYVGKRDPDFEFALETRAVANKKQEDTIRGVGGVIFDDYTSADDWAMAEQYRGMDDDGPLLIAKAPGRFLNILVDGMPLYVPPAAKYIVTERQVVEYTWEVDATEVEDLDTALNAIDGVPDHATSRLIESETTHRPA